MTIAVDLGRKATKTNKQTIIKAKMSLNFCQIPSMTKELAALECMKNHCIML